MSRDFGIKVKTSTKTMICIPDKNVEVLEVNVERFGSTKLSKNSDGNKFDRNVESFACKHCAKI